MLVEPAKLPCCLCIVKQYLRDKENRLVGSLIGLVQTLLPRCIALPEVVACETTHIVVGLAVLGDVWCRMRHRIGVVMTWQSLAAQAWVASTVKAFDVWTEIVNISAELHRVVGCDDIVLAIEFLAWSPESPLRESIDIVGIGKLTYLGLNRRLEGDRQTRVTAIEHIPEVASFTTLIA